MSEIPQNNIMEWNSKELKTLKKSMIEWKMLSKLSKKKHSVWVSLVATDLLIICFVAIISELYFSIPLYFLIIMIIGARQVGIGTIALHDGAHGFLAKDSKRNRLLANVMLCALTVPILGIDAKGYLNGGHFKHHRHLFGDKDPENIFFIGAYSKSKWVTIRNFLLMTLSTIFGITYFLILVKDIISGKWAYKLGAALILGCGVVVVLYDIYLLKLIFLYWILPLATWGLFINFIRALAEHYPINALGNSFEISQYLRTRDVIPSWFDKLFVTTRNANLHLSHHLFPAVPFYNLVKLQAVLSGSDVYKQVAHQTFGYHRFLNEYLFLRHRD